MPISLLCSSCQQPLKVPDELAGKNCSCPYCKTIMRVPTPQINDTPTIKGSEERVSGRSRQTKSRPHRSASIKFASDGSNVSLLKSAIIGISAAVIVFLLLLPLQQMGYRLGTMFWDSVGINFPTTLLMFWSFAILLLKQRKLSNQKNAFIMDVLPATVSEEITLESLDGFVEHINNIPRNCRETMLVNRVIRGIEHFRVRKSAAETVTMMESQSGIDVANVNSSYAIIKVFIWAMPILGFIGTVMGVSTAVSGLSATLENASDVSAVTSSMKSVFGGLGTAFDTTLLALIMSMLVKIPTSALQRNEGSLVTLIDEYCNENLLRRLNDGKEGGAERGTQGLSLGNTPSLLKEALMESLGTNELKQFQKQSAENAIAIAGQIRAAAQISAEMQNNLSTLTSTMASLTKQASETTNALKAQLQQHKQDIVAHQPKRRKGWFSRSDSRRKRR
ncbi:MAG: MotA/TolQ/ExbB proton channel family protein [Pirellulales bacterium]|nr:hypothetical protein [Rhodopirellula sp.]MCH2369240.1 MotA/TolQ/ExbB proton channel family protein [Pirellulales bacterium]